VSESPYNVEDLPQIRAGAAQTVITPPLDCYLAGYFHDRLATRVRDDLYCRALVLEGAGARIALVSLDLVCVVSEWADVARGQIQERTGIGADKVLICATHTHTGPAVRRLRPRWVQEEWLSSLPEMIADTVARASDNMFDALLFPGRQEDDYC
jgi:predicted neutral ceramidase superfamily lipid hydrolase